MIGHNSSNLCGFQKWEDGVEAFVEVGCKTFILCMFTPYMDLRFEITEIYDSGF